MGGGRDPHPPHLVMPLIAIFNNLLHISKRQIVVCVCVFVFLSYDSNSSNVAGFVCKIPCRVVEGDDFGRQSMDRGKY